MRIYLSVVLLLVLCTVSRSQRTALDDNFIGVYRNIRELYLRILGKTSAPGGKQVNDARNQRRLQTLVDSDRPFPCNVTNARSPKPPKSVHELRPGDIDIVASMGDSLSAGFGAAASQLPHAFIENRGISWIGGGQATWREYLTLPNIIKVFNPNLFGYALGDGYTTHKESQFNVAEGFAISQDMPYMADTLIKRIKKDPRVDLKSHWKLINLMIGSNDFCVDVCYHSNPRSVLDNHRKNLLKTFRFIRDNLPRTIISLVLSPHLKVMVDFVGRSPACQITAYVVCGCLFSLRWRPYKDEYYAIMKEWQKVEEEIAMLPEFQTEEFAIVAQPFATNISFPVLASGLTDFTYLSTDCFHLSQKSYARAANALWNNLMQPIGGKSINWDVPFKKFLCPTPERPYIPTLRNSNVKSNVID